MSKRSITSVGTFADGACACTSFLAMRSSSCSQPRYHCHPAQPPTITSKAKVMCSRRLTAASLVPRETGTRLGCIAAAWAAAGCAGICEKRETAGFAFEGGVGTGATTPFGTETAVDVETETGTAGSIADFSGSLFPAQLLIIERWSGDNP